MDVLDVGTGSGILAIAAARLGARSVLALDIDRVAVESAGENCAFNDVSESVVVQRGSLADIESHRQWDLILANILAPVLIKMLQDGIAAHLRRGGAMVLSGIIEDQTFEVEAALENQGLVLLERLQINDWVALLTGRSVA
jgi:ribosomal protein L11 methyltransferase